MKANPKTEIGTPKRSRNPEGGAPDLPPITDGHRPWAMGHLELPLLLALGFLGLASAGATQVSIGPVASRVLDTKPVGTPHGGVNDGAAWVASNSDGTTTRAGVMQFVATNRNQIIVPAAAEFNSDVGTIMFWLRTVGAVNGNPGTEGAMIFGRRAAAGTVIVLHDNGRVFEQHTSTGVESVARVDDGNWHHVAITYDQSVPGALSIFVDGAFDIGAENLQAWTWSVDEHIELGTSWDLYWRSFNGFLDDVRVYNRQLTDTEIAQVHRKGALVDTNALVLRLNFDAVPLGVMWDTPSDTLQSATNLNGTFMDVPDATSPYLFTVPGSATPGECRFFRTRE